MIENTRSDYLLKIYSIYYLKLVGVVSNKNLWVQVGINLKLSNFVQWSYEYKVLHDIFFIKNPFTLKYSFAKSGIT